MSNSTNSCYWTYEQIQETRDYFKEHEKKQLMKELPKRFTVEDMKEFSQKNKMNEEEIIHLFETVGSIFIDEQTSKLTPYKKLIFTQEGFTAEIWSKGQSTEEVVKVIAHMNL